MARRPIFLILIALTLLAIACSSSTDLAIESTSGSDPSESEFISGEPTAIPLVDDEASSETIAPSEESTEEPVAGDDESESEEEVESEETETCVAPEFVAHFVDVALDDPDGGLNMREAPSSQAPVIDTFARSSELIPIGNCEVVSSRDWWEVTTSDGSQTGWVAARFLSDLPVFNPGIGTAINDAENVGLSYPTLEEIVQAIADSYGFDEDLVITEVVPPQGVDSIGGEATYELSGLKDDASNGYLVDIAFSFDREEDGGDIVGYTSLRVTSSALCTRGVTDDGLCI